eukprot:197336_1
MDKPLALSSEDHVVVDIKEAILEVQPVEPEFVEATSGNERREGQKIIKNLDELPINYERMEDGSYDQEMNPKGGVGCIKGCRQSGNIKSWISLISTLGFMALFVYLYITEDYWFFAVVPMLACFCMYTVEWAHCSSSREYLDTALDQDFVHDDIERLNKSTPNIVWKIECYHYRHYKTGKSTKRKKIVTYT